MVILTLIFSPVQFVSLFIRTKLCLIRQVYVCSKVMTCACGVTRFVGGNAGPGLRDSERVHHSS